MSLQGFLYSETEYGDGLYGNPLVGNFTLPPYSARPMVAVATSYLTISVNWTVPSQGYQLRLVRNSFSTPADQNDGIILQQSPYAASPYYFDTLTADSGGMWLYYSLFMLSSSGAGYWQRAADCEAMLPKNWGYGERLFELLPKFLQVQDDAMNDPIVPALHTSPVTWASMEGTTWRFLTGEI